MRKRFFCIIVCLFSLLLCFSGLFACGTSASKEENSSEKYVGIENIKISEDLHLIIYLNNGEVIDAGYLGVSFQDVYIVDDTVYYFNDDHVRENKDNEFIYINGNVYYAENNTVVKGLKLIGDRVYDFGDDGKMKDTLFNNVFLTIGGSKYYVVNNYIVKNYYIIEDKVYDFGDDGKLVDRVINDEFITIDSKTYYIVNNYITKNYYIIENKVYDFGDDGVLKDETFDKIFLTIGGSKYYVVNNYIVKNYYIIEDKVYDFGDDGKLVDRVINDEFITIDSKTYYIVNNYITKNYYIIEDKVYDFGDDGVLKDTEFNEDFIVINGDTYYVVNNYITLNYLIIDGRVYYFGTDGIMRKNTTIDGYCFGDNGYITDDNKLITIDGKTCFLMNGVAVDTYSYSVEILVSDADDNNSNNQKLEGAKISITYRGYSFVEISDSDGRFYFTNLPSLELTITIEKDGYITTTYTLNLVEETTEIIVMDIEVSNNLQGKISIADSDTNSANNSSLSGVQIKLVRTSSTNSWVYTTTSDANGIYVFTGLTAGTYVLTASKEGYIPLTQTIYVHYNQSSIYNFSLEMIASTVEAVGSASGSVYDNSTGNTIGGLTLYVRKGVNSTRGEVVYTTSTSSTGQYVITDLIPGNYSVQVVDERAGIDEEERYGNGVFSIKILANKTISNQNGYIGNTDGLGANSMRIVLTWGETPRDLDSHLVIDRSTGTDEHVYYSDKIANNANLDVDDTSSYGPETITITQIEENTKYYYYVHNYSGGGTSVLSSSGAIISVYIGASSTPYYSFSVPTGSGLYWNVFTYDSTTGLFGFVNTITSSATIN